MKHDLHLILEPILLFIALPCLLIILPFTKLRDYRKECKEHLKGARQCSLWAYIILLVLCFLCYPVALIQFLIVGNTKDIENRKKAAPKIDGWILFWAAFTPICLFLLIPHVGRFFALLPLLRLFDMLYVLFWLLVTGTITQKAGRSASFLLLHYFEAIMIFACCFLWVQAASAGQIFADSQGSRLVLSSSSALYFSFITGATVGYGDIVPVARVSRMLAGLELFCVFYLVAIAVPRVFSYPTAEDPKRK
jgi:hypothetical protein